MILTTIQAYIFSFRPSTHWSIAIQATCEPGREALIRATHNPVNCRHIDVLKLTLLSILLEPIHRLRWPCKNWLPIMRQMDKLGHCKIWKASFLVFSANCEQVIGYFSTDHSSNMSELHAPTNSTSLTLKQASKRLNLKRRMYVCHLFHVNFWIIKFIIQKTHTLFFIPCGQTEQISIKHCSHPDGGPVEWSLDTASRCPRLRTS